MTLKGVNVKKCKECRYVREDIFDRGLFCQKAYIDVDSDEVCPLMVKKVKKMIKRIVILAILALVMYWIQKTV